jgi:hypothetical protein
MLNKMKEPTAFPDPPGSVGMVRQRDFQRVSGVLGEGGTIELRPECESFFVRCDKDVEK